MSRLLPRASGKSAQKMVGWFELEGRFFLAKFESKLEKGGEHGWKKTEAQWRRRKATKLPCGRRTCAAFSLFSKTRALCQVAVCLRGTRIKFWRRVCCGQLLRRAAKDGSRGEARLPWSSCTIWRKAAMCELGRLSGYSAWPALSKD